MKLTRFVICLLFIMFNVDCFSQDEPITQEQLDIRMAPPKMYLEDPIEFFHNPKKYGIDPIYLKKVLEANPDLTGWHVYYSRIAHLKFQQKKRERDSVIYYSDMALKAYKQIKDDDSVIWEQEMFIYFLKGTTIRKHNWDYNKSLENIFMAIQIAKEKKMVNWFGTCNFGIARNHFAMENDSIALHYFLKATEDSLYMQNARASVSNNTLIGVLYQKLDKNEEAKTYVNKAILESENGDYKRSLFPLYGVMAGIHRKEKMKDSMRFFYKKAISRYEEFEICNPKALRGWEHYYNLYQSYFQIENGELDEAILNIKRVITNKNFYGESSDGSAAVDKDMFLLGVSFFGGGVRKARKFEGVFCLA